MARQDTNDITNNYMDETHHFCLVPQEGELRCCHCDKNHEGDCEYTATVSYTATTHWTKPNPDRKWYQFWKPRHIKYKL